MMHFYTLSFTKPPDVNTPASSKARSTFFYIQEYIVNDEGSHFNIDVMKNYKSVRKTVTG